MKIFDGIIVSLGMNNTVVVTVERRVPHPLYKKLIKRNSKFLSDSAGFELNIGDKVKIIETRPISKNKYFKIMKVVEKKVLANKTEKTETKKIEKEQPEVKLVAKTTKKKTVKVRKATK